MFSEHFREEKTKELAKHKDRASKRRAAEEFEKTRQKEKEVFLLKTLKDLTPQAMDDLPEVKEDVLDAIKFGVEKLCVKFENIHVFATGEVREEVEEYLKRVGKNPHVGSAKRMLTYRRLRKEDRKKVF